MKYRIETISLSRTGVDTLPYTIKTNDDSTIRVNVEIINTKINDIFMDCRDEWMIEDRYESFWNRLNDGYKNNEIVKVVNVEEFI